MKFYFVNTCYACPEQYDVYRDNGQICAYVRLRWGNLYAEYPSIDGEVIYTVKPGTQTNTKVRLRGKGIPTLRNKAVRGDHYVTLVVQVPTKLTQEQKDLLRQFEDSLTGETVEAQSGSEHEHEHKGKKKFFKK